MKTKICSNCKKEKSLVDFSKARKSKDGLRYWCRGCESKEFRGWWLQSRYGITIEDYDRMFQEQQGCCAICNKHQSKFSRALHVDHNHETKQVRGLLCKNCNMKIGWLEKRWNLIHTYLGERYGEAK